MKVNSLWQPVYFNPMSWALEKWAEGVVAVNKILGGVPVSLALILGGVWLNYFSEPLSWAIASQVWATQAAVNSTLDTVGNGMVAFWAGDIILGAAAKSYLRRK